jgi:hypothetical protein
MDIIVRNKKKDYGNGILNFAYNYPLAGVLLLPILFDWPAKAMQAAVRTAKYGDPYLGAGPVAFDLESDQSGMMGLSLFGSIAKQGGHFDEGSQFPPRGDMYRDTRHLTSHKTGPMYGESGFYNDTRNLSKPRAPAAQTLPHEGRPPQYGKANQQMVNIVGEGSVFRGISGLGRVRR